MSKIQNLENTTDMLQPDVRCEEVIICNLEIRGLGTTLRPYRRVLNVYNKQGDFIAQNDPFPTLDYDLIKDFAVWLKEKEFDPYKADDHLLECWINERKINLSK